jgi:probable HAF family extracellular repeat protein
MKTYAYLLAAFLCSFASAYGEPTYKVTDQWEIGSSFIQNVAAISDTRHYAGTIKYDSGYGYPSCAFSDMSRLYGNLASSYVEDGEGSFGLGINNSGQLVGYATTQAYPGDYGEIWGVGPYHAFIASPSMRDLGTLGGTESYAAGINTFAKVAGASYIAKDSAIHAFLSAAGGGTLKDLGTLGGTNSTANAVNDKGQIVGWSNTANNSAIHAFFRDSTGSSLRDLGTLGGTNSYGMAINSTGQVAGLSQTTGNSAVHVFVSDPNGGALKDLGIAYNASDVPSFWPDYDLKLKSMGINDRGQVVGTRIAGPFLYTPGFGVQSIDSILADKSFYLTLWSATAINNSGQIIAAGVWEWLLPQMAT